MTGRHPFRDRVVRPASATSTVGRQDSPGRLAFWPDVTVSDKQDTVRAAVLRERQGGRHIAARHQERIAAWQKAQKLVASGGFRPGSLSLGLPLRLDTLLEPTQIVANKANQHRFREAQSAR